LAAGQLSLLLRRETVNYGHMVSKTEEHRGNRKGLKSKAGSPFTMRKHHQH
jgi:hypothetical protein